MTEPLELDLQRKRQATLLYHYASIEYLRGLKTRIDALISGVDFTLDEAHAQGRDDLVANSRWGTRDTVANWSSHAYPALKDFQKSTAWHIASRAKEIYGKTGAYQCGYMLGEHSMRWATEEEEENFKKISEALLSYAYKIDDTTKRQAGWSDFALAVEWKEKRGQFPKLPRFRVRPDLVGETDKLPPRTGVYVPQDDPFGTLQFAWTGDSEGALGEVVTLNAFGLQALRSVGAADMWVNEDKMAEFANLPTSRKILEKDTMIDFPVTPDMAPSDVARSAYTERPCKWYFVELLHDEWDSEPIASSNVIDARRRGLPSEPVPVAGFWNAPALHGNDGRRYFKQDERFPDIAQTAYGAVIWYFDPAQQD